MPHSHTINENLTRPGETINKSRQLSGSADSNFTETVAIAAADYQIDYAMIVASIQCMYLVSSQDVLMETNDGTVPTDTFNLLADIPLILTADGYFQPADIFASGDITGGFYVTNASGVEAEIMCRCVYDTTPA